MESADVIHAPRSASADVTLSPLCLQVRQNYIRRRLQITFNALNRLSQSEFNLEQLFSGCPLPPQLTGAAPAVEAGPAARAVQTPAPPAAAAAAAAAAKPAARPGQPVTAAAAQQPGVTFRDVDRQRGRPLTRYQRNMMVFNWLHTLDESGLEVT